MVANSGCQWARSKTRSILGKAGIKVTRISPYTSDRVALTAMLRQVGADLILDVGANIGQYAKATIGSGYDGRIVSFEPLSEVRAVLLEEAVRYPKWDVAEQCALGDHEDTVEMHISDNSEASSLLCVTDAHLHRSPTAVEVATERVKMARLDRVAMSFVEASRAPFLKIDVQGFEEQVIAGSTDILPKLVGVQVELSSEEMYEGQKLFSEMISMIDGMGFTLYRMIPIMVDHSIGRWLQADGIFFRR